MLSLKIQDLRAPVILDQQNVGRFSRMDAIQQNLSLASDTNRHKKILYRKYFEKNRNYHI